MWRRFNNLLTNELASRKVESISAAGAEDLAAYKATVKDRLAEKYPAWSADMDSFDTGRMRRFVSDLSGYVDDPRFDERPGWTGLRTYLSARAALSGLLAQRDTAGGSANLQAGVNDDVRAVWDAYVHRLVEGDLAFGELHARWFSNDSMADGG